MLLAQYPDLIPGDQIDPEAPRRWILVSLELGVPKEEGGSDNWSLDHLFLDQEGIPTFVECKRASDTRSRREVVAQMLDYAANGTEYWGMDRLRQAAAETAQSQGKSLDEEIRKLVGGEAVDVETYWKAVEENLRTGRVRLLFVTDQTPLELRRLVEFLNAKMSDVEVLAVEIKQFVGPGEQKAVVPRVIGQTEAARQDKKPKSKGPRLSGAEAFLETCDPVSAGFFRHLIDVARARGYTLYWGEKGFSVRARFPDGTMGTFVYGMPWGEFDFYFGIPISQEEESALRNQLLTFGIFKEAGKKTLKADIKPDQIAKFKEVYDYILDQVDTFRLKE